MKLKRQIRGVGASETLGLDIAAKHGVTPAQAVLRWGVERGIVVIPKSVTASRIAANRDLFSFALDEEDMKGGAGGWADL